jgi:hypothetical protein
MSALGCESPLYEDKHHQNWRGFARRWNLYLVCTGARSDDHDRNYHEGRIYRICSRLGNGRGEDRNEPSSVAVCRY